MHEWGQVVLFSCRKELRSSVSVISGMLLGRIITLWIEMLTNSCVLEALLLVLANLTKKTVGNDIYVRFI